ncbi:MAG: hypothetical protein AABX03_03515 [Nanoarchaeota archaeon]
MTERLELLIVEDKAEEANQAKLEAKKLGLTNLAVAQNLEQAFELLDLNPQYIASDLFFPAGNLDVREYVERFLPLYQEYEQKTFPEIKAGILHRVIKGYEEMGISMEKYERDWLPIVGKPMGEEYIEMIRDHIHLRKDYSKFVKFQGVKQAIKDGSNLPLGIPLMEKAKERGIPIVIVTSTYHHDHAFEPVSSLITVPYYDTLIGEDNKTKNWQAGINALFQERR